MSKTGQYLRSLKLRIT